MERQEGKLNLFWPLRRWPRLRRSKTWLRFRENRWAVTGLFVTALLFLLASFCYVLIPDRTPFANLKSLPINNQLPGFEVTMLRLTENKPTEVQGFFSRTFCGTTSSDQYIPILSSRYEGTDIVVKEFSASGDSSFESRFNIADVVYAVNLQRGIVERNSGLFFETSDGTAVEESIKDLQGFIDGQNLVKKKFILGTDRYGRDVFSRFLLATRATLFTAILATLLAAFIGIGMGVGAGLAKGRVKGLLVWMLHTTWSIPALVLAASVTLVGGNGFGKICFAIAAALWVEVARLVYFRIQQNREQKFVVAAKALGIPKRQIIRQYLLQDLYKPFLAAMSTVFCSAIMIESSLNFLGIGHAQPTPTWGGMIRENFGYMIVSGEAYMTILPGLAIMLVSVLFLLLARQFRKALGENYLTSIA